MTIHLNTHPDDRKDMVKAISERTGPDAAYMGPPSFAYQIGAVTVNRDGTIDYEQDPSMDGVIPLLIERGWLNPGEYDLGAGETDASAEPISEQPADVTAVAIRLPLEGWTVPEAKNLLRLVCSKQYLIRRMTGNDDLYLSSAFTNAISAKTDHESIADIQEDLKTGMTDYMTHRLADLRARQEAEEHMPCPRCGADTMKHPVHTNAMSRVADIFICDACGTTEALLAHMNQQTPLTNWAAFKPTGLPSDFKARLARDVLEDVVRNQTETLTRIFRLCQDDPKNAAEYRLEAFESCPGLTELWTEPFAAKYQALDGSAVVRLTMSGDGHPLLEAGLADK